MNHNRVWCQKHSASVLETFCFGDKLKMLVTDLKYWFWIVDINAVDKSCKASTSRKNHQHVHSAISIYKNCHWQNVGAIFTLVELMVDKLLTIEYFSEFSLWYDFDGTEYCIARVSAQCRSSDMKFGLRKLRNTLLYDDTDHLPTTRWWTTL